MIYSPKLNEYIPHVPTECQHLFLILDMVPEVFYGGAAGGGKSDALLMAALQYVDVPGYRALLLRRTYKDLALPGALMDRAKQWLMNTDAKWDAVEKAWIFPSGAVITFGYLDSEDDKYRYQGAEFQFVGFDELTQFTEAQYRYLFSRLRRLKGSSVPLRMRSASNPGGIGHDWVKSRFIDSKDPDRHFVPAKLNDNPHVDTEEYERFLRQLDPVTRAQLRDGNWDAKLAGGIFYREGFSRIIESIPNSPIIRVRAWDLAATPGGGDLTAGVRASLVYANTFIQALHSSGVIDSGDTGFMLDARSSPTCVIFEDCVAGQWGSAERDRIMYQTAAADARESFPTIQLLEQQPGEAGKSQLSHFASMLGAFPVEFVLPTGSKYVRAMPYSAATLNGRVALVRGHWNHDFIEEHVCWQGSILKGERDDRIDAGSMCYNRCNPNTSGFGDIRTGHRRLHAPRAMNRLRTSNP